MTLRMESICMESIQAVGQMQYSQPVMKPHAPNAGIVSKLDS